MAPIRIGFIGLSASGGWASNAHFPYLKSASDKYTFVALLNSSKESAENARKHHELPTSVKTYGDPKEFAADPDVDLVVCSVRVDRHFATVKPSLEAGKNCYVEWPLARNLAEAEELGTVAKKQGAKTMVGLQARQAPIVNKVRQLIKDGKIGKVLSCTVLSTAGNQGATENARVAYFNDEAVGGNMLSIHAFHMIDYVLYALDDRFNTLSSKLSTQRKQIQILNTDGSSAGSVNRTSADHLILQGELGSGAVISIFQRGGPPIPGNPGLRWNIHGSTGEIQVTSDGSFLQVGYEDMKIVLHDQIKNKVEDIDFTPNDDAERLPMPARNVARLYEKFYSAEQNQFVGINEAVQRHRLLEQIKSASWDNIVMRSTA